MLDDFLRLHGEDEATISQLLVGRLWQEGADVLPERFRANIFGRVGHVEGFDEIIQGEGWVSTLAAEVLADGGEDAGAQITEDSRKIVETGEAVAAEIEVEVFEGDFTKVFQFLIELRAIGMMVRPTEQLKVIDAADMRQRIILLYSERPTEQFETVTRITRPHPRELAVLILAAKCDLVGIDVVNVHKIERAEFIG